ncbi:MAG: zinc ribbon domain-containing protein [Candidatus Dormibacteraeota bacterium]|uniref:Zinc ribbon domain-containing protein n=1 Tax=Candidatus Amunia macphersoniae TaxID=3127014 RepID=A0A934NGA7_9BACT|nr:zinc ribbon domain-containing protein [Candidatus Dormibacteraeota bacterium]
MPVYEYRCNDCHSTFEVLRRMGERELSALCPGCESRASMPLISQVAASRPSASATSSMAPGPNPGGGCCGGGCGCR